MKLTKKPTNWIKNENNNTKRYMLESYRSASKYTITAMKTAIKDLQEKHEINPDITEAVHDRKKELEKILEAILNDA